MFDAYAGRNQDSADSKSIIAQLKGRIRIEQVEAVVVLAREAESLAKAAWARGELAGRAAGGKSSIQGHLG